MVTAPSQSSDERVHLIDLTDRLCDTELCCPVVGDVIVYRDHSRLFAEYARALVPYQREHMALAGGT